MATIIEGRTRTKLAGEDLEPYRMVRFDTSGDMVYSDYGDPVIGVTSERESDTYGIGVNLINMQGTIRVEVAGEVFDGDYLWPTADGKGIPIGPGDPVALVIDAGASDGDGSIVEAMPVPGFLGDVYRVGDDFVQVDFSESADAGSRWLKTSVDTDTDAGDTCTAADDSPGGVLSLVTNNHASDSESLQMNGESVKIATGKPVWLTAKFNVSDADKVDVFVGLVSTDTDLQGGVEEGVFFRTNSNDGNLDYCVEKVHVETTADTAVDLEDATDVEVGIYVSGAKMCHIYVDGAEIVVLDDDDNLPDAVALSPALEIHNANAAAYTLLSDYIWAVQER